MRSTRRRIARGEGAQSEAGEKSEVLRAWWSPRLWVLALAGDQGGVVQDQVSPAGLREPVTFAKGGWVPPLQGGSGLHRQMNLMMRSNEPWGCWWFLLAAAALTQLDVEHLPDFFPGYYFGEIHGVVTIRGVLHGHNKSPTATSRSTFERNNEPSRSGQASTLTLGYSHLGFRKSSPCSLEEGNLRREEGRRGLQQRSPPPSLTEKFLHERDD